jgi:serine/threonine protein phosphatase PrpC
MTDRWYYTHAGQTLGPVAAVRLRQLAAAGQLLPTDLIWPEGGDRSQAAPARAALDCGTPSAAPPDSLDDIRADEEEEQAFLSLEWDADNLPTDEGEAEAERGTELPDASVSCRLVVGSATTRGRVRDHNEDSLLVQQYTWGNRDHRYDAALLVVADGMGGHAAGERASGLVIRTLSGVLTPLLTAALSKSSAAPPDFAEALDRGLHEANRIVREVATDNAACKGMGSTAAAVLVWDGQAFISLVGDCRVHHWRGGRLTQVTRDQTLVARMVELGQLTPQEAARHPRRNEVAMAVGKYALLSPARYEVSLAAGDWLLLSSDGLQAHVEERLLQETIAKADSSAADLANRLVDLANQRGGSDNCTVIAVHCV